MFPFVISIGPWKFILVLMHRRAAKAKENRIQAHDKPIAEADAVALL